MKKTNWKLNKNQLMAGWISLFLLSMLASCKDENTKEKEKMPEKITSWNAPDIERSKENNAVMNEGLSPATDSAKMAIFPSNNTAGDAEDEIVEEARRVGGNGDLKITLLWDFHGDIDIHVKQPTGKMINYTRKRDSNTGGFLDVDNIKGGRGSAENVFWDKPPKGNYKVWVKYYHMSQASERGIVHVVVMRKGERAQTFDIRMTQPGDEAFVTAFDIQ